MKIGYKATKENMTCRDTQYDFDNIFYIEGGELKQAPKDKTLVFSSGKEGEIALCTKDVIHYCNELKDCLQYYPSRDNNKYFKVEILGDFNDGTEKSGTTALRFIEEVDIKPVLEKREMDKMDKKLNLDKVRRLQEKFPYLILGGSTALYLQGAKLKRLEQNSSDLDLIHPFWIDLSEAEGVSYSDAKNSGNTFNDTFSIKGVKIDFSIEPNEKYHIVEFNGHKYKVNPIERILQFKSQYAQQKNGSKHRKDLIELTTGKRPD